MSAARPLDPRKVFIELAATALIVGALSITLVGFHVKDVPGGFDLVTRFWDVLAAIVIGVVGRAWLIALREGYPSSVALTATPITVFLILALDLPAVKKQVLQFVPFNSPVLQWIVALIALGFAIIGIVRFLRQLRRRPAHDVSGVPPAESAAVADGAKEARGSFVRESTPWVGAAFLLLAVLLPFLPGMNLSTLDIAVLVLTYVMLGWGLNIVVGLAGLLDLGYVAFYAVGAYSFALMASPDSPVLIALGITEGISFWYALPFAGLMAALAGVLLGFPVLRLRGDYLAIVTLGFGEMIRVTLLNFYSLTKGPDGISKIPPPGILGYSTQPKMNEETLENTTPFHDWMGWKFDQYDNTVLLFYVILAMALMTNWFTLRIRKLPVGRAWEALREDEIASRSLGINPTNTKLTAFALGAMFGGFAGSFFATRQTFVSPESFTFIESAVILAIVVLGGFGSQIGVVVAAFLLIGMPEIFRELQDFRMLFFGGSMVLIMLWRPAGLLAHRDPTVRLRPAAISQPTRLIASVVPMGGAVKVVYFLGGLGGVAAGVIALLFLLRIGVPAELAWIAGAGVLAAFGASFLALRDFGYRDARYPWLILVPPLLAEGTAELGGMGGLFSGKGTALALGQQGVVGVAFLILAVAALGGFAWYGRHLSHFALRGGGALWRQAGGALWGTSVIMLVGIAASVLVTLTGLFEMKTLNTLFGIGASVLAIFGAFTLVVTLLILGLALWRLIGVGTAVQAAEAAT